MSTATQANQVAPVPAYADALTILNQSWGSSKGIPNTAARIQMAMALAGIPLTNSQALKNLVAQSNLEYPSGPIGNNLLGTSLVVGGSHSTDGDGVQAYNDWQDGVYALASMLQQQNMAPMFQALYTNASPQGYANALAGSSWEGSDPSANAAYAQSFLGRYNTLNGNGSLDASIKAGQAQDPSVLSGAGQAGQATPGLDISTPWSWLNTLISDVIGGFGIGWKAVLTIIGGILLIGVALFIFFRRQTAKVAEAAAV